MALLVVQFGIPGVAELIVVLFMFVLMLAVPVLLIVLVLRLLSHSPREERVQELEREVAELRGRLDERDRQGDEE